MRRLVMCFALLLGLAACGGAEPKWASDAEVAQARFVQGPPYTVTLFTVLSTKNGSGAHAGLMINGTERVMFDPAGTWYHPNVPERNDVHYGISPRMVSFYIDYHARETFDVVEQTVEVSQGVANLLIRKVQEYGAVPKAQCTKAISSILQGVPGFEGLPQTWYPKTLMEAYATLPGVQSRRITDDDADNNHGVLLVQTEYVNPQ